jgi:hypothetical protein
VNFAIRDSNSDSQLIRLLHPYIVKFKIKSIVGAGRSYSLRNKKDIKLIAQKTLDVARQSETDHLLLSGKYVVAISGAIPMLMSYNSSAELDKRFIRLFRTVWAHMPVSDKAAMRKYFRTRHDVPRIEVISSWSHRDNGTYCSCDKGVSELRFWEPAVAIMPSEHIKTLIGRVLTTAVLYALFHKSANDEYFRRKYNENWGYDEDALDSWLQANADRLVALENAG